jgi:hypothetical protein
VETTEEQIGTGASVQVSVAEMVAVKPETRSGGVSGVGFSDFDE